MPRAVINTCPPGVWSSSIREPDESMHEWHDTGGVEVLARLLYDLLDARSRWILPREWQSKRSYR
jgi:hypothetical protein